MADVVDAVKTRLVAHAGTNALIVGRAWFQMLPQNPTLPASVVQKIDANRPSAMGSDVGLAEGRIQIRACGLTRAAAFGLAEQHRAALQRYRGTSAGVVVEDSFLVDEDDDYDPDTKVWSVRQDFLVWWREA